MPPEEMKLHPNVYKMLGIFVCALLVLISIGAPANDIAMRNQYSQADELPDFQQCQQVNAQALGWPIETKDPQSQLEVCTFFEQVGEAAMLIVDEEAKETTLLAIDGTSGSFKEPILVKSGALRDMASFQAQPPLRQIAARPDNS